MTLSFAFSDLHDFWVMSGHGPYVWGAYALTFLVVAVLALLPGFRRRAFFQQQRAAYARESRIAEAQEAAAQAPNV